MRRWVFILVCLMAGYFLWPTLFAVAVPAPQPTNSNIVISNLIVTYDSFGSDFFANDAGSVPDDFIEEIYNGNVDNNNSDNNEVCNYNGNYNNEDVTWVYCYDGGDGFNNNSICENNEVDDGSAPAYTVVAGAAGDAGEAGEAGEAGTTLYRVPTFYKKLSYRLYDSAESAPIPSGLTLGSSYLTPSGYFDSWLDFPDTFELSGSGTREQIIIFSLNNDPDAITYQDQIAERMTQILGIPVRISLPPSINNEKWMKNAFESQSLSGRVATLSSLYTKLERERWTSDSCLTYTPRKGGVDISLIWSRLNMDNWPGTSVLQNPGTKHLFGVKISIPFGF